MSDEKFNFDLPFDSSIESTRLQASDRLKFRCHKVVLGEQSDKP